MNNSKKTEDFYKNLKTQLYDTMTWPSEYLYKFIVTTNEAKINKIETIFNNLGAVITTTPSKNRKYTSISISVKLKNPEEVINKYKEVAEQVEDVISL